MVMTRFLAALLLLAVAVGVQAESATRIQYAEAVSIHGGAGRVAFDAYGRRFDMTLAKNERVLSKLSRERKAELARSQILRGTLVGQSNSWVRLTEFDGRVEGAIWDGQDFYAVTSLENIAPYLTTPIPGAPTQTVVYRLSDTINAFPENFCADAQIPAGKMTNGLDQYRGIVAELAIQAASSAAIPLEIDISLIADATFQSQYGSYSTQLLLARAGGPAHPPVRRAHGSLVPRSLHVDRPEHAARPTIYFPAGQHSGECAWARASRHGQGPGRQHGRNRQDQWGLQRRGRSFGEPGLVADRPGRPHHGARAGSQLRRGP
jgi:hypothetical protein